MNAPPASEGTFRVETEFKARLEPVAGALDTEFLEGEVERVWAMVWAMEKPVRTKTVIANRNDFIGWALKTKIPTLRHNTCRVI